MAKLHLYLLSFLIWATPAFAADKSDFPGVKAGILVHADAKEVYRAIRDQRKEDPSNVEEIAKSPTEALIKETFDGLPVIGHSFCEYRETYDPYKTVDYKLVASDRFKAFEGGWTISQTDGPDECYVTLSSFVDTGLFVPFARRITNFVALRDVKERLEFVKKSAEASWAKLSSRKTSPQID